MEAFTPRTVRAGTSLLKEPLKDNNASCLPFPLQQLNPGQGINGQPCFIFLLLYNGSEPLPIFSVSAALSQNLNNSWFSFWRRHQITIIFFNLILEKDLVVQWYPEMWTFPKIKVYSPSSQTLSDLSQVRLRALMAVCFLYYSYYGLCGSVDDGEGDIALLSLPSICAGLL